MNYREFLINVRKNKAVALYFYLLEKIKDDLTWEKYNDRRLFLIEKKFNDDLTEKENRELEQLQNIASIYINKNFPLPFDKLDNIE